MIPSTLIRAPVPGIPPPPCFTAAMLCSSPTVTPGTVVSSDTNALFHVVSEDRIIFGNLVLLCRFSSLDLVLQT